MMSVVALTVGGVVAYVIHWFCSIPVPPGFKDPWFMRMLLSISKFSYTTGWIKENLMKRDPTDVLVDLREARKIAKANLPVKKKDVEVGGVKCRLYVPEDANVNSNTGIVYYHGGGWVLGDIAHSDASCQHLAHMTGATVLSVEYRRAPEHPFPTPFNDCFNATIYFLQNAKEFGVDPERVAIMGDSAGGNLAAATALRLRDEKVEPQPKMQILGCPCLQAIDFNTPSYIAGIADPFLTKRRMAQFWLVYATGSSKYVDELTLNQHTPVELKRKVAKELLSHEHILHSYSARGYQPQKDYFSDAKIWAELKDTFCNPYFAPLMAKDVKGLPKTIVITAEQDVLRDDGIWYAKLLKEAGVDVTHIHMNNAIHCLPNFTFDKEDFVNARQKYYGAVKSKL